MGLQIRALSLHQAELLASSSSESSFSSAKTGLHTVAYTGWELGVGNASFNTLRAADALGTR